MNEDGAKKLVTRGMKVILSCESEDQLAPAYTYAILALEKIRRESGIGVMRHLVSIERAMGFAQCQIKVNG